MSSQDVIVVGAGIVGLAHAWSAAERGFRVMLVEQDRRASGASIRNFGMVWPVGQPLGEAQKLALRSQRRWLRLRDEAGIWVQNCGSIHLAHHSDEQRVLQEFLDQSQSSELGCQWLAPAEVQQRTPAANPHNLLGGLFSPSECGVNPPAAIRAIPGWLARQHGVTLAFGETVTAINSGGPEDGVALTLASGQTLRGDRVIVCGGSDVRRLYPQEFARAGLKLCKLQMLRTVPQPDGWRLGTHIASGLTLRHYASFADCPSLAAVKQRFANAAPELDRFGIHVMASQNDQGEVILGDSHEYDDAIEPFDKSQIDDLMLRELRKIIVLPDWTIAERWHGVYAKHSTEPVVEWEPGRGIHVCTGTGGAGMTLSFGIAERTWDRWTRHT